MLYTRLKLKNDPNKNRTEFFLLRDFHELEIIWTTLAKIYFVLYIYRN